MCEVRDIPLDKLYRDPLNPRDEPPTDELIESLRRNGMLLPVTTRPNGNSGFYVTDGWERVQGAMIAGIDVVPCEIHPDELSSMRAGHAKSNVRVWTKYDLLIDINNYYRICRKQGMMHTEAIKKTSDDLTTNKSTVERYVRVWELPDSVKILLKQPNKRTYDEWNLLLKYNRNIKRYNAAMSPIIADYLMKYIHEVSEERLIDVACNVIGRENFKAKQIISEATRPYNLDKPLREIINMVKSGTDKPVMFNLPSEIYLPHDKKVLILDYMSKRRMRLNDFLRYLFDKFIAEMGEKNEL